MFTFCTMTHGVSDGQTADYSYDEVAGVKVDKEASPAEREKAKRALQEYYGYVPTPIIPKTAALDVSAAMGRKHPIFKAPDVVRNDSRPVDGYREFAVAVELLEHAYNGPYTFKLWHRLNKDDPDSAPVLIGRVDVFARPDHSQCADCSRRRAAGSLVRGTIFIDISVIDDVIENHQMNRSDASTEDLVEKVKNTFSAELINTHNEKLAVIGVHHDVSAHWGEIDQDEAPISLTLLSSAVAYAGGRDGPLSLLGWDNHGDVFGVCHVKFSEPVGITDLWI